MTASIQVEQRSPDVDNPVSSFEVGIMTVNGTWVGICIKFSMYDRATKITHWSPRAYRFLIEALEQYYEHLGANAFMFRAKDDPSLVASLPARHPYHTLLTETPLLTEDEIGRAGLGSGIDRVTFAFRGPTLELRPEFGDGRTESIYLHEYTALSLLGYLQQYTEAAKTLTGPAAGNA
jgi:hypothetical protein